VEGSNKRKGKLCKRKRLPEKIEMRKKDMTEEEWTFRKEDAGKRRD
jgi:hypothetical protein